VEGTEEIHFRQKKGTKKKERKLTGGVGECVKKIAPGIIYDTLGKMLYFFFFYKNNYLNKIFVILFSNKKGKGECIKSHYQRIGAAISLVLCTRRYFLLYKYQFLETAT